MNENLNLVIGLKLLEKAFNEELKIAVMDIYQSECIGSILRLLSKSKIPTVTSMMNSIEAPDADVKTTDWESIETTADEIAEKFKRKG